MYFSWKLPYAQFAANKGNTDVTGVWRNLAIVSRQFHGWMIQVLWPFQHHRSYEARLPTKRNERNG